MAASSVAVRCRRPFFFNNNNNAAAAAGLDLGKDSSSNQLKKRQLLPLRKRKSQTMLRSSSSPSAITIPMESATTTTTTTDRLSVYSSLLAADQDVDCNYQLDEGIFKMTMGMEPTTSSSSKHKVEEPPIVSIVANMLDKWMRDSVSEIVRNIGEAPFLVHIYSSSNEIEGDDGDDDAIIDHVSSTSSAKTTTRRRRRSEKTRFEREAAVSDDWPRISRRWKQNSSCKPDGIILVEQLKGQEEEGAAEEQLMECCSSSRQCRQCSKSKTWGIVIQGRELDCPACYILKTTRICTSVGFCTHFCLIKAKCFGDPAELQLRDCWLQRQ